MDIDASPESKEWIAWNGGSAPVAGPVMVEVRFRYGPALARAQAQRLRWSHDLYNAYGADDIVAYRVVAGE